MSSALNELHGGITLQMAGLAFILLPEGIVPEVLDEGNVFCNLQLFVPAISFQADIVDAGLQDAPWPQDHL